MKCPQCTADVLEIDVRCGTCGTALGASGAHRMIGQIVLGQYEVTDVLGQGGMSIVYKGRHKMTEQEVALKILPPELAAHAQVKSRFLEEARALATLDHANIVHLYNFGQENGCFVLAMQLIQGQTWERMVLESKQLDWQTTVRIAIDVLRALEYAHGRGVVHRDMKPSNVLVRAHDGAATVMDFGIAKMTTSTKLTATGQTMGTVRYMSPEQVRGQEVDARTDLYSLGATMFESLTGDTPFDGNTHFEIMTKHLSEMPKPPSARGFEIPRAVEDAVMRSLAKKADDRFDTARDMRKVLEAALREGDVGLLETQRVSRDKLAAAVAAPVSKSLPPQVRAVSTVAELADHLEPASALAGKRSGAGRSVALAVVAAVILAGGGGGAYYWVRVRTQPPRPTPTRAYGETPDFVDGPKTKSTQLLAIYLKSLTTLEAQLHAAKLDGVLARPVDQIIALPAGALCNPSYYDDNTIRDTCGTATSVVSRLQEPRTILVIDDPAQLQHAMDAAIGDAVCLFHSYALTHPDEHPHGNDEICDVTFKFANGSGLH